MPALVQELCGVPPGHEVHLACSETTGLLIAGGVPSYDPASLGYGGLVFSVVRVKCS